MSNTISNASVTTNVATSKVLVGRKSGPDQETQISVEKCDDLVQAIKIHCRCGEQIVINCTYHSASSDE